MEPFPMPVHTQNTSCPCAKRVLSTRGLTGVHTVGRVSPCQRWSLGSISGGQRVQLIAERTETVRFADAPFRKKSAAGELTNHEGCVTIMPSSIGRLATLNGKLHKTPLKRQGTASEMTPRLTAHRRHVARPRTVIPPPHGLTALGQRASCPLKSTTTNPLTT